MTKLLLTFDYEPFFNNGKLNLQETLINPTNLIINNLTSKSRNIFFVDATFLLFLRKNKMIEEYQLISQQVKDITRRGNEVGLHVHPHWDAAILHDNSVRHNFDKFALIDCGADKNKIIEDSFAILQEICPNNKIVSFRAGGLILSGWDSFEKTLWNLGILEDHSIAPRFYGKNAGKFINYSNCNMSYPDQISKFLSTEVVETAIIEYPVSCYKKTNMMKIADLFLRRRFSSIIRLQPQAQGLSSTETYCELRYLTCDFTHPIMFKKIIREKLDAHYLSFINHPKDFTESTLHNIRHVYDKF